MNGDADISVELASPVVSRKRRPPTDSPRFGRRHYKARCRVLERENASLAARVRELEENLACALALGNAAAARAGAGGSGLPKSTSLISLASSFPRDLSIPSDLDSVQNVKTGRGGGGGGGGGGSVTRSAMKPAITNESFSSQMQTAYDTDESSSTGNDDDDDDAASDASTEGLTRTASEPSIGVLSSKKPQQQQQQQQPPHHNHHHPPQPPAAARRSSTNTLSCEAPPLHASASLLSSASTAHTIALGGGGGVMYLEEEEEEEEEEDSIAAAMLRTLSPSPSSGAEAEAEAAAAAAAAAAAEAAAARPKVPLPPVAVRRKGLLGRLRVDTEHLERCLVGRETPARRLLPHFLDRQNMHLRNDAESRFALFFDFERHRRHIKMHPHLAPLFPPPTNPHLLYAEVDFAPGSEAATATATEHEGEPLRRSQGLGRASAAGGRDGRELVSPGQGRYGASLSPAFDGRGTDNASFGSVTNEFDVTMHRAHEIGIPEGENTFEYTSEDEAMLGWC